QPCRARLVGAALRVRFRLDRLDLPSVQRLRVREVEAEMVGRNQASFLRHVRSEMPPERGVQKMRGAVIGADAVAAFGIDLLVNRLAERQLGPDNFRAQDVELAQGLGCVLNFANETLECGEFSGVTNLSAALPVEGALVE